MTSAATTQASAPPLSSISQLSPDFPWPGFAPYQEADRGYFHGRKLETEEILRLLSRDVLTLLVGPTGVGKTSLVQAGVVPVLLESDYLPVIVRLDWFSLPPPPKPASDEAAADLAVTPSSRSDNVLTRQLISALQAAASNQGVSGPKMRDGESLWEYFHRSGHRWWSNRQRVITPVLIIDRFEEAFTVGRANATACRHADRFFEELSELASNRPPNRLARRLENGDEAPDAFVFDGVPVKVLLVLREEFTARLADLRSIFPTLARSNFRLPPFSTSQARDAIERSAAQRNLFADGAVDAVVEFLATEGPGEQTILPAHLSVVCSALSIERAQRGGTPISRDFLSVRPGRLMHDFITAAVSDLPPAARALLEEHLTDLRGNSQRVPLSEALTRTALPREALDTLVQRHLVRIDSLSTVPYVSLAHDLLASVLAITRLERVAQAREQSAVLQQAQAQAQIQAQVATVENKVRRQKAVTWGVAAAAVLVAGAAVGTAIVMAGKKDEVLNASAAAPTPIVHPATPTVSTGSATAGTSSTVSVSPISSTPGSRPANHEPTAPAGVIKPTPLPVPPVEPLAPEVRIDKPEPAPGASHPAESSQLPARSIPVAPPSPVLGNPPPTSPQIVAEPTPTTPSVGPSADDVDVDSAGRSQRELAGQQKKKVFEQKRRALAVDEPEETIKKPASTPRPVTAPRPTVVRPAVPVAPPPPPRATPRQSFNRF